MDWNVGARLKFIWPTCRSWTEGHTYKILKVRMEQGYTLYTIETAIPQQPYELWGKNAAFNLVRKIERNLPAWF